MKPFKRARLIFLVVLSFTLLLTASAPAQNKVVVIPLLGEEATGNATQEDVLKGKTFSNSSATGLTGTRPPAPVQKTGQTAVERTGDDGFHQKGESWPVPRFTAGTHVVTDNLTGLMWQKSDAEGARNWNAAIDYCNFITILEPAGPFVINYDDWRLPNRFELETLLDLSQIGNALPSGHPFVFPQPGFYWSSTTYAGDDGDAWTVYIWDGNVSNDDKLNFHWVWCVHDGN